MSRVFLLCLMKGQVWQSLPSGLGTATTERVLWKGGVLGEMGAGKFAAEGCFS